MRISIVTPSFNQAAFLEAAMLSVLDQRDVELDYVVMDGGSTDGSVEIIQRHASRLSHWETGRDAGQYDAITRGHARTTGEVMGWLNSDDLLMPGALSIVAEIFTAFPDVQWLTTLRQVRLDERGRTVRVLVHPGFSRGGFLRGETLPVPGTFATGFIQQESTFWRRSLWKKAGAQVGREFPLAGDFDLWARFFQYAEPVSVECPLGGFRFHDAQKTGNRQDAYLAEATRAFDLHNIRRWSPLARLLRRTALANARGFTAGVALRLGLLFPSKIARHDRKTNCWNLTSTNA